MSAFAICTVHTIIKVVLLGRQNDFHLNLFVKISDEWDHEHKPKPKYECQSPTLIPLFPFFPFFPSFLPFLLPLLLLSLF